jgi:hypothetical protein
MKKLFYIIPLTIAFAYACGGGGETTEESAGAESTEEAIVATGTAVDLGDYGMPYSMMVPDAATAQISENDWGGVEILNGPGFMVQVAFGEGDLTMFKSQLNDGIYTSTILDEAENYVVYKREIADAGVAPEVHFMYVATFGEDIIEISNLKENVYDEATIKKMLAAAKSFQ